MATRRTVPLSHALLLLLLALTPIMVLLGSVEGRSLPPSLLFWLFVLVPLIALPLLLLCCDPEESEDAPRVAARNLQQEIELERFSDAVAPLVPPRRAFVEHGVPIIEGIPRVRSSELFDTLEKRLREIGVTALVESVGDHAVRVTGLPATITARWRSRSSGVVQALLFATTLVTTTYAGALHRGVNLFEDPLQFAAGLPYALALLAVLAVHELGHYVVARVHRVDVTLPYFIPVPMGLGTFGAFIQMKSLIRTRQAVFDIGIAGPLAGLVVALPILYYGLENAPAANAAGQRVVHTGSSILLAIVYQLAHGGDLGAAAINLSPVAFAGWIGLFVTALNLAPVGQLDGGHIAYGLFGRRHARTVSIVATLGMLALGFLVWPGLLTWALLIALLAGFSHMPALDDVTAPDPTRFALGAVAFGLLLLIILPVPGLPGGLSLNAPR